MKADAGEDVEKKEHSPIAGGKIENMNNAKDREILEQMQKIVQENEPLN